MTITAKEMNRIAMVRRQEEEKAIREMVINCFEWNIAPKIEAAAAEGRLHVSVSVEYPVCRHIDVLLAYCHTLGFETAKTDRYRRGAGCVSFRVMWKDVPEDGIIPADEDDFCI